MAERANTGRVSHRNRRERKQVQPYRATQCRPPQHRRERIQPYPAPLAENPRMTNTQRRVNAIRRERRQPSPTPQHRTMHPQQQSKTRVETAVSSNSSGNHCSSNAQRRVPASRKESGHSYARHRSVARVQHSITQTISEKLRERIQPYAATLVYSDVCTHLA